MLTDLNQLASRKNEQYPQKVKIQFQPNCQQIQLHNFIQQLKSLLSPLLNKDQDRALVYELKKHYKSCLDKITKEKNELLISKRTLTFENQKLKYFVKCLEAKIQKIDRSCKYSFKKERPLGQCQHDFEKYRIISDEQFNKYESQQLFQVNDLNRQDNAMQINSWEKNIIKLESQLQKQMHQHLQKLNRRQSQYEKTLSKLKIQYQNKMLMLQSQYIVKQEDLEQYKNKFVSIRNTNSSEEIAEYINDLVRSFLNIHTKISNQRHKNMTLLEIVHKQNIDLLIQNMQLAQANNSNNQLIRKLYTKQKLFDENKRNMEFIQKQYEELQDQFKKLKYQFIKVDTSKIISDMENAHQRLLQAIQRQINKAGHKFTPQSIQEILSHRNFIQEFNSKFRNLDKGYQQLSKTNKELKQKYSQSKDFVSKCQISVALYQIQLKHYEKLFLQQQKNISKSLNLKEQNPEDWTSSLLHNLNSDAMNDIGILKNKIRAQQNFTSKQIQFISLGYQTKLTQLQLKLRKQNEHDQAFILGNVNNIFKDSNVKLKSQQIQMKIKEKDHQMTKLKEQFNQQLKQIELRQIEKKNKLQISATQFQLLIENSEPRKSNDSSLLIQSLKEKIQALRNDNRALRQQFNQMKTANKALEKEISDLQSQLRKIKKEPIRENQISNSRKNKASATSIQLNEIHEVVQQDSDICASSEQKASKRKQSGSSIKNMVENQLAISKEIVQDQNIKQIRESQNKSELIETLQKELETLLNSYHLSQLKINQLQQTNKIYESLQRKQIQESSKIRQQNLQVVSTLKNKITQLQQALQNHAYLRDTLEKQIQAYKVEAIEYNTIIKQLKFQISRANETQQSFHQQLAFKNNAMNKLENQLSNAQQHFEQIKEQYLQEIQKFKQQKQALINTNQSKQEQIAKLQLQLIDLEQTKTKYQRSCEQVKNLQAEIINYQNRIQQLSESVNNAELQIKKLAQKLNQDKSTQELSEAKTKIRRLQLQLKEKQKSNVELPIQNRSFSSKFGSKTSLNQEQYYKEREKVKSLQGEIIQLQDKIQEQKYEIDHLTAKLALNEKMAKSDIAFYQNEFQRLEQSMRQMKSEYSTKNNRYTKRNSMVADNEIR